MNKRWILAIALVVLAFAAGLYLNGYITAKAINVGEKQDLDMSSWTKAVCDGNSCIDINITCAGDKVISMELSSDLKKFPPSWKDLRTQEELEKIC